MTLIGFLPKPHEPCRTMIGYFYFVSHFLNISFLTRTLVQGSSLSGTTTIILLQRKNKVFLKFSFQKKATCWPDVEFKEENSILDRDLNLGL